MTKLDMDAALWVSHVLEATTILPDPPDPCGLTGLVQPPMRITSLYIPLTGSF